MVSDVPPELASTLRRLRVAHGFSSQRSLADAASYSVGTIGNVEAGTRNLSREACEVVAAVLGLSEAEYAELLRAAGHDQRTDDIVATFASRLDAVEAELHRQREVLESLLDRLPLPPPAAPPRRRAKR